MQFSTAELHSLSAVDQQALNPFLQFRHGVRVIAHINDVTHHGTVVREEGLNPVYIPDSGDYMGRVMVSIAFKARPGYVIAVPADMLTVVCGRCVDCRTLSHRPRCVES